MDCAIAVDGDGAAYITGETGSDDFPTTAEAFDTTFNGGSADVFVTKLNMDGSDLVYSTFLGENHWDHGASIAVDRSGAAHITGWTGSSRFPSTPDAFDMTHNGESDAFVTKLNADGSDLLYSTFLGGEDSDYGQGIAVNNSGAAYVTGRTYSFDFPTTEEAFDTTHGGGSGRDRWDVFVAKLGVGSMIEYKVFLPIVVRSP